MNIFKDNKKKRDSVRESDARPKFPKAKLGENHNPIIMEESGGSMNVYKFKNLETETKKQKLIVVALPV